MKKQLREQIAQEICKGICGEDSWEGVYPHRIDTYRSIAEATMSIVHAALVEPTEGMLEAVEDRSKTPFDQYFRAPEDVDIWATEWWKQMLLVSPIGQEK